MPHRAGIAIPLSETTWPTRHRAWTDGQGGPASESCEIRPGRDAAQEVFLLLVRKLLAPP
jgi:hypothetical protein